MINAFNVTNAQTAVTSEKDVRFGSAQVFIFGIVFWGNLVDNIINPRLILIACEAFIALQYVIYASFTKMFLLSGTEATREQYELSIGIEFK